MPTHKLIAIAGAVAVLGLLLVACGGADSGGSGVASTTPSGGVAVLSPQDYQKALAVGDPFLVNVHVPYEGEIEATDAFVPFDKVKQNVNALPPDKDAPLYIYCRSGRMSAEAAIALREMGYTNIVDLAGGMEAWRAAGLPIVTRSEGP